MHTVETLTADICVGLREGYDGDEKLPEHVHTFLRKYLLENKMAVSVFPGKCLYPGGEEGCCWIRMIQYPRFVISHVEFKERALKLAASLKDYFRQFRVSIVFKDETVMLGDM